MTERQMRDALRLGMAAGLSHAIARLLDLTDKLSSEAAKHEVLHMTLELHDLAHRLSNGTASEQELLA